MTRLVVGATGDVATSSAAARLHECLDDPDAAPARDCVLTVASSLLDVQTAGTSAYRELAMVYKPDVKSNSGKAYPTTPGHFENPAACTND